MTKHLIQYTHVYTKYQNEPHMLCEVKVCMTFNYSHTCIQFISTLILFNTWKTVLPLKE